uniref:Uncharacterized protein n=1 Tax=Daphnia galeata TaxID=27404 RepID=A0A8J2RMS4_9CRUS|nr:unnamed protein product [Daphnia galeata]
MSPVGGIYRLWFAVFDVRYWRYWMLCDETYPLAKHFFTSNAYQCLEVNAHSLVLIELRQELEPAELFLPFIFGSQQCETYFKALRSFTPVGSTQTNIFHCRRIQFLCYTDLHVVRPAGPVGQIFTCGPIPCGESLSQGIKFENIGLKEIIFNLLRKCKHGEASTVKPLKIIFYRELKKIWQKRKLAPLATNNCDKPLQMLFLWIHTTSRLIHCYYNGLEEINKV